jgi:hypothetical protein
MGTKHTPGPWAALPEECDRAYIRIRGQKLGCRYKVANVLTLVYEGVHEREAEETRANARLIAASPELLEALELCAAALPAYSEEAKAARAAIAKATGEQS